MFKPKRSARRLGVLLLGVVAISAVVLGQVKTDPAIVVAARDRDFETVRTLIAKRVNVNEPGRDGSTALLWAVYGSDLQTARALIAADAYLNAINRYGVTPLLQASRTGDTAMIAELLKSGADVRKAVHPEGETPLMAASRTGKLDAVELLLKAGSDPNAFDSYQKQTALMRAAEEGHVDVVNALLSAKADPNAKAHVSALTTRKHADHATGGFTALMFAVRNGHENVVRALVDGGADLKATNGDGVTATSIAIVNDRFDLAKTLLDLGADANDGALFFAVDMHDATSDMYARDGSRLRADHQNQLTALDLIKLLLERGADPNKPFVGQIHNTSLCCAEEHNSSPFYRAALAADVEALKLMVKHGAQVDWSPAERKKEGEGGAPGRGGKANVGKTPAMMAMTGGRGAPFAAGPGFERLIAPPYREPSNRDPGDALKVLLEAGANPNAKANDGATLLHQAVTARRTDMIRYLVAAGAKLDAVNKDNLTPLLLAEKPEPPPPPGNNNDSRAWRPRRDSRDAVIATLRELMKLGPNDPAPVPPPLPATTEDQKNAASATPTGSQ
ncbi:MAG TPA: ankyrin repeat domain-containing protein [Terriglobia bacterium]|nr:ankyrin repeat domain-containing protein [Terriglobia bacterium]